MSELIDQKINKVMFQKSGASNKITRLNIPITWIRDYLGITEEDNINKTYWTIELSRKIIENSRIIWNINRRKNSRIPVREKQFE